MRTGGKKKTRRSTSVLLLLIFLIGLSLLLYPTVSNYINGLHQTRAISSYVQAAEALSEDDYAEMLNAAMDYNSGIAARTNVFVQTEEEKKSYDELLNISGSGVMGYIEIPSIEVVLPICHGTSERVLQTSVGHVEWTSLPVGGAGTHCVLSGHRGLPSAKLFTNLDKLSEGDVFTLNVLDEVLTYEVDRILIVDPDDTEFLQIVPGEDYCTLVTCTPYGINTHRLLVRGHRIETESEEKVIRVTAEAIRIEPLIVAPIVGLPLLCVALVLAFILDHRHSKGNSGTEVENEEA